jgi:hypothetical protein
MKFINGQIFLSVEKNYVLLITKNKNIMSDRCAPRKFAGGYIANQNCVKWTGASAGNLPEPTCDQFANPNNRAWANSYEERLFLKSKNQASNVRVMARW